jgi:hypothetical protein
MVGRRAGCGLPVKISNGRESSRLGRMRYRDLDLSRVEVMRYPLFEQFHRLAERRTFCRNLIPFGDSSAHPCDPLNMQVYFCGGTD